MNLGMELDHTENYLETALDEKKVTEVASLFSEEKIVQQMKSFLKDREDRKEKDRKDRKVSNCLFPNTTDDVNEYYTSYDDHLKLLNDEIENQKAAIERGLYRLKLLGIKEKLIIDERDKVNSENFKLPDYLVFEGYEKIMKEHIFRKHPKLVGDYYGEHKYTTHAGKLHIRPVYDKDGKLVKILCLDCYFKFLEKNGFKAGLSPTKDDGELDLHDKVGGK